MENERILVRIPRNANEELIVKIGNYWKIDVVDIRWNSNGNPTKKGVRVNMEEAKILYDSLDTIFGGNHEFE
tara:strand:- start:340 stop:555 length:216 start_codon:yes stop_codon:yes gene_type:complete